MGFRRLSFVSPQLEVTFLYWHLVDAFWVVLFPVLYVAGQA
jgi:cytochrome c oxidase subunit III